MPAAGGALSPSSDSGDSGSAKARPSLLGHLEIMRADHWVKNVFVLPGMLVALSADASAVNSGLWRKGLLGIAAVCIVASSNYVLNEILDAPTDRSHPIKRKRAVPSGQVSIPAAYVQWLLLLALGLWLAWLVSPGLTAVLAALWLMGCIYNIPPVRTKDIPYIDVLSEAVNNPLRMLAGWYIVGTKGLLPASLLLCYWMIGAYFMAIKRFAELRAFQDTGAAAAYRKSFGFYTTRRLLISIMFYASAAMLFLGAFIMRYRIELILATPLIALVMAVYLDLGFRDNSAAQAPEKLHREPLLMASVCACALLFGILFFVDLPWLHSLFAPTMPNLAH